MGFVRLFVISSIRDDCRVQGQKTKVSLTLSQATLNVNEDGEGQIPKDHRLDVSPIAQQTLAVFSHLIRKNSYWLRKFDF